MKEDISQKIIDEIIVLSELSNHRLKELTHKLIDSYLEEKKKYKKDKLKYKKTLKLIDKRGAVINQASTKKDKLLAQQSKMASMGEMMDAVAHQWKQPLNSLSMMNDMLLDDFRNSLVNEEYLIDMTETVNSQIDHMVNTLSEFRTFFRPSKKTEKFSLKECISSVQVLMKDELIKNNVELDVEIDGEIVINGIINEFKHLFLNLISNSIDAFNEREIKPRKLEIRSYIVESRIYIEFEDNAKGIPEQIIRDIFKPHITTKEDGKGTGIGLYMSSQIVQKHHGNITVRNSEDGTVFTIVLFKQV